MKHIVIFRTSGSFLDFNTYNCQELGLAKALVKKGYKLSLILGGPTKKHIIYDVEDRHIDIYYLTYSSIKQSICVFHSWKKLLDELKPDVLQVHDLGMSMTYMVSKWARKRNIRCVLIQGTYNTTLKPGLKQLECLFNRTFGKAVIKNVNAIGAKTKAAAAYVQKYYNKEVSITPVGLDESKFVGCSTQSDFRKRYGLENQVILLYVGVMEQRRNPLFLLELMKEMPGDFSLVLVGEGPLFAQVKDKVKKDSIHNVVILGKRKQEELPAIYAASDLFLLASSYEIFGMVIMESMYFGTPVISTSTAGADTLIDENTGKVIDGLDVNEWKKAILQIAGDQNLLSAMKKRCQFYIANNLIWNKASDNFEKLYFEW